MRLEIRASNQDVQRYLDSHISQLPGCVLRSSDLQDEIKANIIEAVNGMFLLAQLYLDSLKGKKSPKAIRTALKKLPTRSEAYDYAYKDAMERIEGQLADEEDLAKQALLWIICAKRPLATSELEHALAVEINELQLDIENLCQVEDIISICARLITVDEESDIIRLVHYTTQEYFDQTQEKWFPNAQTNIATICVIYLSFDEFESGICQSDDEFKKRLQSNNLYDYASHNWGHHAQAASTFIPEVISFLKRKAQVEASSQALMAIKHWQGAVDSQKIPKQITGLHLAAYFGVNNAVQLLISRDNLDLKDSYSRTPLSWAAENGHEATVKLLLEHQANIESKDRWNQTPLLWAARSGYKAIVQLLLEHQANIESKDRWDQTPLSYAAWSGHETIVQLLLKHQANIESKDTEGQTPLLWAARSGHETIVQLLLKHQANIELKDTEGQTPLSWAASRGHEAVVQLLLKHQADIESKDKYDQTPLSYAAERGHEAVVQLLLKHKANIESKDNIGRTPLSWAAERGHEAVVQLLLKHQADIESKDSNYGQTPLSWAASRGHEGIVKLLLKHQANIESRDSNYGQTPLSRAAENGHKITVQLLLEHQADIESKDRWDQTPLSRATWRGHEAIVQLLLEHKAKIDSTSTNG